VDHREAGDLNPAEREHLLVFPDRDVAEEIADDLDSEGFAEVHVVREALAGEDDSEDHEWAVFVRTADDEGYAVRFEALAEANGGWYDPEPHTE
jgi:hypothetical protein